MHAYKHDTIDYRDHLIEIFQDEDPPNPRTDWDNFTKMLCWHNRYNLGDEMPRETPQDHQLRRICEYVPGFENWLDMKTDAIYVRVEKAKGRDAAIKEVQEYQESAIAKAFDRFYFCLPLYLYDHSGITISTGSFSCPWDSGQVGFVYVSKEDVRKEYKLKRISPKAREAAHRILRAEVQEYDDFLTGNVWGYVIKARGEDFDGEEIDQDEISSCWGFFGDPDKYVLEAAKETVDYIVDHKNGEKGAA